MWTFRKAGISQPRSEIVTFTFPISWVVFHFCQISLLWKCSGRASFIVMERVIPLLTTVTVNCLLALIFCKTLWHLLPLILLNSPQDTLGPGMLRLRVPVTFSFFSWLSGYHRLQSDRHKAWVEPSVSLPWALKDSQRPSSSPEATRLESGNANIGRVKHLCF